LFGKLSAFLGFSPYDAAKVMERFPPMAIPKHYAEIAEVGAFYWYGI